MKYLRKLKGRPRAAFDWEEAAHEAAEEVQMARAEEARKIEAERERERREEERNRKVRIDDFLLLRAYAIAYALKGNWGRHYANAAHDLAYKLLTFPPRLIAKLYIRVGIEFALTPVPLRYKNEVCRKPWGGRWH